MQAGDNSIHRTTVVGMVEIALEAMDDNIGKIRYKN